jgi:hypothetical protein
VETGESDGEPRNIRRRLRRLMRDARSWSQSISPARSSLGGARYQSTRHLKGVAGLPEWAFGPGRSHLDLAMPTEKFADVGNSQLSIAYSFKRQRREGANYA